MSVKVLTKPVVRPAVQQVQRKKTARTVAVTAKQVSAQDQETVQSGEGGGIRAFIVMPFSTEYDRLLAAIKGASIDAGVQAIRADEIAQPGPIINQIFDTICQADCIIAEIGSKNANVYYEIAIAHCVEKPSILVARQDRLSEIPFDVRHNRIIPYREDQLENFRAALAHSLNYIKDTIKGNTRASLDDHIKELAAGNAEPERVLNDLIVRVGAEFGFCKPRLEEWEELPGGGYAVKIIDHFGERAAFTMDVNGNIKRKKRVS